MSKRRLVLVMAPFLCVQVFVSFALTPILAGAQEPGEVVFVVRGSNDITDCRVVYSRADDPDFNNVTRRSDPRPCQAGVVWAYRTTHTDAVANGAGQSSNNQIVSLTGDAAQDEAAVQAQINAIHDQFAPGGAESTASDDLGGGVSADSHCNNGSVGEYRRASTSYKAYRPQAKIGVAVYYQRVNCKQWKVYRVSTWLLDEPVHRVYARYLDYERVWDGNGYMPRSASLNCERLSTSDTATANPRWLIKTNYQAQHESIDNENFDRGCSGLGNSYNSARFYLTGWMR